MGNDSVVGPSFPLHGMRFVTQLRECDGGTEPLTCKAAAHHDGHADYRIVLMMRSEPPPLRGCAHDDASSAAH